MHGFFHILFAVGLLALVTAMIRPALAARLIATPTRKKILVRMLPILIVTAALSGVTKPKTGDDAEAETAASDSDQAYAASDMSADKRDFVNTYATAKSVLQKAQQSSQVNNGICGNALNELVGYMRSGYKNDIAQYVQAGAADMGYRIAATQLNNYVSVARNNCGVSMY
ncbi:hypothetical protein [Ralstonia syzygii]|uniref:Uncharacterized protein n=1 Tax=Ralstonia syzygii R24 TaxID=907261 RepID=G3A647_9RALS|nr:hypothetical protein [Ralstonia syzygii]CCA85925.1 exported hypothetical protein [Ralstonia syzygii R24]